MAVLCDTQIRELVGIEPLADNLKRPGRVSYGLSSYGYDVRVGSKFKVFTNVAPHGGLAVVDPKNFTGDMFVTIDVAETGRDHVIIPPNSFALAETVETIHVPRNLLAICVGKSTYARCFRGDTRVALVDGTAPTLEEMARRAQEGELFWGYSIGPNGRMIVSLLESPRYVGRDSLVEITLDNGEPVFATPDHEFMMRDGRMIQAQRLQAGHSLMPLYRYMARGYEMTYQPLNGHLYPTHRMAHQWKVRHGRGTARWLERDRSRQSEVSSAFRSRPAGKNHKVASVRGVSGEHDVYCLTVPEAGNFALEAGVFVRNCGIICNVTPLEPEWRGRITLEISNTTPLPAKIYANEGIAQIIFLKADRVCAVSYADKGGKYQDQAGLTLPRVD
jgi:deoxycytidine triphosphate deaminase